MFSIVINKDFITKSINMNFKLKMFLLIFLSLYLFLLILKQPNGMIIDEGSHAMNSFFYYKILKDILSNPSILLNLKDYIFRFYVFYPALYINYYPPLFGLISSVLFTFFGISQFATRLTTMIFSIASLIILYFLGKKLYDKKIGLLSIPILAFTPYFFMFSNLAMLDIPLLFFILLSILLFYKGVEENKKYFYYFGFVFGLGFLMKIEIIVLLLPLVFYLIYRKKINNCLKPFIISGLIFCIVILPFLIVLIFYKGMDLTAYWLLGEGSLIACPTCYNINLTNILYYPKIILYGVFPLVVVIPIVYFLWKRRLKKEDFFLLIIIISYFVIFTIFPTKNPRYIMPILPLFCLLLIHSLMENKKYFYLAFAIMFFSQLIMGLIYTPYDLFTTENEMKRNLEIPASYLNENIVKNGNVFMFPYTGDSGFIFNFARVNDFNNHVFRWRDCIFENITAKQFEEFVNKNNIYFVLLNQKNHTNYQDSKKWVENNLKKVFSSDDLLIYENPRKEFDKIDKICVYNCNIKLEICYVFNSSLNVS